MTRSQDLAPASGDSRLREVLSVVDGIHRRIEFRFPPLRLEDFLSRHDSYRVFEVDLPAGLDGKVLLSPDGEQKTIYLRRQNPRPRLRFTLAHEIIHAELHFPTGRLRDLIGCRTSEHGRDRRRNVLEREADFGAAALLMPLWMIDRYVPVSATGAHPIEVVRRLARMFRVSEAAMRIQLQAYQAVTRYLPERTLNEPGVPGSALDWMLPMAPPRSVGGMRPRR